MNRYLTIAIASLTLAACASRDDAVADSIAADSPATAAPAAADSGVRVSMRDATGRDVGTLTLTETTGGVAVSGTLNGLPPGEHGMHIHMVGRCDAPSFESAGEHWNPTSRQHGSQNPQGPHLGDMPNITVGSDSSAAVQGVTSGGALTGTLGQLSDADGAALIVHASPDDYRTDPSGGTGARIACGVITGR